MGPAANRLRSPLITPVGIVAHGRRAGLLGPPAALAQQPPHRGAPACPTGTNEALARARLLGAAKPASRRALADQICPPWRASAPPFVDGSLTTSLLNRVQQWTV